MVANEVAVHTALVGRRQVDPAPGAGQHLSLLDPALIDGLVRVSDAEAIDGARRLAREEGIFGGFSGGACLVTAEQLLRERHAGETIVIVIVTRG